MEFKALRVAGLNEELATKLETSLTNLAGVTHFKITVETNEISIKFDETQLGFRALVEEMTKAGCPLQNIDAAILL